MTLSYMPSAQFVEQAYGAKLSIVGEIVVALIGARCRATESQTASATIFYVLGYASGENCDLTEWRTRAQ